MRPHPCNVRPLGNALSDALHDPCERRRLSLGKFSVLSDSLLIRVLEQLITTSHAFSTLTALINTSTYLRAFAVDEDLWRCLIFNTFPVSDIARVSDSSSWRNAYYCLAKEHPIHDPPTSNPPVYSDVLFHKWRCLSSEIPKDWLCRDNITRISAKTTSVADFRAMYEKPGIPVIITDLVSSWPAFKTWDHVTLTTRFGDTKFHAGGFDFPLSDYFKYCASVGHRDDQPLYIFDYCFADKVPPLAEEYTVPKYFEDLFSVLADQRPDYRWLIIGPSRSGSSFHIDPNGTAAWNAVIRGKKKWVLFPPDCPPPGVTPSDDHGDVTAPVSVMEWFLNFYDPHILDQCGAVECVVNAGEMMFVPMGWWHCVLNVNTSIAITQNFVGSVNVTQVAKWLKERPQQISGCRSEGQAKFVRDNFVRLVSEAYPQLRADLEPFANKRSEPPSPTQNGVAEKIRRTSLWESLQGPSNRSHTQGSAIWNSLDVVKAEKNSFSFGF